MRGYCRRAALGALFGLAIIPGLAASQEISEDQGVMEALNLLELWVGATRDYEQIPSVSAAVVYDQELLWSEGFGFADLERGIPVTPETIFSIGSSSKAFTTTPS